jgi:hypothetical protein
VGLEVLAEDGVVGFTRFASLGEEGSEPNAQNNENAKIGAAAGGGGAATHGMPQILTERETEDGQHALEGIFRIGDPVSYSHKLQQAMCNMAMRMLHTPQRGRADQGSASTRGSGLAPATMLGATNA